MKNRVFLAFVSPSLFIMLGLMVLPLVTAVVLGLHFLTFSNLESPEFVGWQNYRETFSDPSFWRSFRFTMVYILTVVPAQMFLGFLVALMLDKIQRFRGVFIAIFLIPFIVTPVVGTLMYRIMFDRSGLYWYLLKVLFDYDFVMTTFTVRLLIILQGIWYTTPYAMITLFAGLQTLPQESMEAAFMDGANALSRIWHIILPHLQPLLLFIALMSIMNAYRVFDNILVITKQNPTFNTDTFMSYIYKVAVSYNDLGVANTMSIITVIGIFIVLAPFLVITYRSQMEKI